MASVLGATIPDAYIVTFGGIGLTAMIGSFGWALKQVVELARSVSSLVTRVENLEKK